MSTFRILCGRKNNMNNKDRQNTLPIVEDLQKFRNQPTNVQVDRYLRPLSLEEREKVLKVLSLGAKAELIRKNNESINLSGVSLLTPEEEANVFDSISDKELETLEGSAIRNGLTQDAVDLLRDRRIQEDKRNREKRGKIVAGVVATTGVIAALTVVIGASQDTGNRQQPI